MKKGISVQIGVEQGIGEQMFLQGGSNALAVYLPLSGNDDTSNSDPTVAANNKENIAFICAQAMVISKLAVFINAPGVGESSTFTLRKNGADTAITVTINDNNQTGNDNAHSVTCAQNDLLAIHYDHSGGTATTKASYTLVGV